MSDKLIEAVEKLTASVNAKQSSESAINDELTKTRASLAALEATHKTQEQRAAEQDKLVRELSDKILKFEADVQAERDAAKRRRPSGMNLAEARDYMAEAAEIPGQYSRQLFSNLGTQHAKKSLRYLSQFGDRSPMSLLMYGAMIPTSRSVNGALVRNVTPLVSTTKDEVLRDAHLWNDVVFLWTLGQEQESRTRMSESQIADQCPYWRHLQDAYGELKRAAMDTADTSNWVPTSFSAALIEAYEYQRILTRYLDIAVIPRSPYEMPMMGAAITVEAPAENTADPESATHVTGVIMTDEKVSFSLIDFATRIPWSMKLEDDSIIDIAQQAPLEIARAWRLAEENAIINGDTTGTHQDSDITGATHVQKQWKGFRKHAIEQSYKTDIGSSHSANGFRSILGEMGVYASPNPSELFFACGPVERTTLLTLTLDGTYPATIGVADMSSRPRLETYGNTMSIFGAPVVATEAMREVLNASGVYDGVTLTKRAVLWVNRRGWKYAMNNSVPQFLPFTHTSTFQRSITMRTRRDFKPTFAIASNKTVWYGYNLS